MSLAALQVVLPPPSRPRGKNNPNGPAEVRQLLGVLLPQDYLAICEKYGVGAFGDVSYLNAFADHFFPFFEDYSNVVRFMMDPQNIDTEWSPPGVLPDKPGVLPFLSDMHGNLAMWLVENDDPMSWPILVLARDPISNEEGVDQWWSRFDLTTSDFLFLGLLGALDCEMFPRTQPAFVFEQ